jgi:hypothetical protein
MIFCHLGSVTDSVYASRGGKEESANAGLTALVNQCSKELIVYALAERRIQFDTGIVGDAGQVNHSVTSFDCCPNGAHVSNVAMKVDKPLVPPE